jgi:hypothetical protein
MVISLAPPSIAKVASRYLLPQPSVSRADAIRYAIGEAANRPWSACWRAPPAARGTRARGDELQSGKDRNRRPLQWRPRISGNARRRELCDARFTSIFSVCHNFYLQRKRSRGSTQPLGVEALLLSYCACNFTHSSSACARWTGEGRGDLIDVASAIHVRAGSPEFDPRLKISASRSEAAVLCQGEVSFCIRQRSRSTLPVS